MNEATVLLRDKTLEFMKRYAVSPPASAGMVIVPDPTRVNEMGEPILFARSPADGLGLVLDARIGERSAHDLGADPDGISHGQSDGLGGHGSEQCTAPQNPTDWVR